LKDVEKIFFKAGGIKPDLSIPLPLAESQKIKEALSGRVEENIKITREPIGDRVVKWLRL
jgi:hypothetical protein